ncbi:MAG TPA: VIT1/CCC1 transporter family protein [Segetibacter sp.]|nr:VIT1/CCC1 transporter family protein [Segetibacter sp.]
MKKEPASAVNIGMSYVTSGLVPLLPYFLVSGTIPGLKISAFITLICLFIFGYFKSKMTGVAPITGALKVMLIGAVAAAAFSIARLLEGS